ncbi:MAG: nickel pincer cofactor biosynthesis protein LarB [Nitrospirae bacterium]|nr:nickel pincer cofactor biosynthesis protein LarB [Nitrospirota bacterium]
MNIERLRKLLDGVQAGTVDVEKAMHTLKGLPFEDLGFAVVDHHRHLRQGAPEVIYCEGKTVEQVRAIAERMLANGSDVLATRASADVADALKALDKRAVYHGSARAVVIAHSKKKPTKGVVLVVSAGTADMPVAEEAAVTAEALGSTVERMYDVGVSGIHRLLGKKESVFSARVIIVVAGMDGALASVVGGLVDKPVIAVPTSVGYGASFGGVAALLTMLNSCASGVSVVNIDNGFGAACMAHKINMLGEKR